MKEKKKDEYRMLEKDEQKKIEKSVRERVVTALAAPPRLGD